MIVAARLFKACVLTAIFSLASQAHAQALDIAPISETLDSNQRVASFTLTNRSDKATEVQIRPYKWVQNNARDELTLTTDLMVSPPFATIAPGQSQTIRMQVASNTTAQEKAFRIVFDQLPATDAKDIQLTFSLIVPVFVKAPSGTQPPLEWMLQRRGDQLLLTTTNQGAHHLRLTNLKLIDSQGESFKIHSNTLPYLLAGSEGQWVVSDPAHSLRNGMKLLLTTGDHIETHDTWLTLIP
ncbi:fimbrial biogenesis chaperone [Rhodococcus sp. IEGM1300]